MLQRTAVLFGGTLIGADSLFAKNVDWDALENGPDAKGIGLFDKKQIRLLNEIADTIVPTTNTPGANMPPGAPGWHLPARDMPLVFEGRSPAQLAQQLADPAQNGGKTMQQLLHHVTADPLVLWGWHPGDGRAPVSVPHATFVAKMQQWIDAGCPIPR